MSATITRPRASRKAAPVDHPLRTEKEYAAAIAEIESILDDGPKNRSPAHNRLELLSILVAAYEDEHDEEIQPASPQALVEFMAAQKGIGRAALADLMGGRSRLSDFLSKKRDLSIGQIIRLRRELGIPADLLLA